LAAHRHPLCPTRRPPFANRLAHPRSLYLREDKIVELVDPWIRRAFAPANLRSTLQAMADAQHDDGDQHQVAAAREKISTCQTKLDRYRAALDAGTDPVLVQQWISQVQAQKAVAEADLRQITGRRIMTIDEINTLVEAMSGIATILWKADPVDKAEVQVRPARQPFALATRHQAHIQAGPPLDTSRGLTKWIMY
jgi:hypothetical protein